MMTKKPISVTRRLARFAKRLHSNQSGLALIEFAFSMPILMGLGMYGTETAFLATTNMKVSQTALTLADNAARLDQVDNGVLTPTINESDVNQMLQGAALQAETIDLMKYGRVTVSSLEITSGGQQFIRWQRCLGKRAVVSKYDDDLDNNNVVDTTFTGMGPGTSKLQAVTGSAVMYVEIEYQYQPLFKNLFGPSKILRQEAGFNIRGNRNLTAGLNKDVTTANQKTCNKFTEV